MDGYHSIYLQWIVTKSTYKYHSIYLPGTAIIAYSYNGWLPKHKLTMNGYYNIYFQWTVTIISTYN